MTLTLNDRPHGLLLPYGEYFPRIAPDAFIAPGAVVIGDVKVGPQSSIWFNCTVRADEEEVRIGRGANIQDGTVIHVHSRKQGTYIGNDVTVGHQALLHACTLEEGAYVGMGARILDEAVVEGGAMLAAGALLTQKKRVRRGELWAGAPARLMRRLSPDEMAAMQRTSASYAERARAYMAQSPEAES